MLCNAILLVCVCFYRTLTQDILSLTYTRTCWPKLLSPRRQRKGNISHELLLLLPFYFNRLILWHDAFPFFLSFLSACSPSWDASGTPAPPLHRPPPRRRRRTDTPWEPGKQVPTLQPAPMTDAGVRLTSIDHHRNRPTSSPPPNRLRESRSFSFTPVT